ncbi:flagellar motor switch protein FliM [Microbacterium sp.]|uniref:flagellar motor switch protein FliM n=1 Tax=Microbacterium sp. TaxID=51671 RepID=UPI003A8D3949
MVIEDSAHSVVPADSRSTADVDVYDFGRPASLSREHARILEVAFETFSRQWASQLSAKIGVRAHVSVELVTMQPYGEYAASLPTTTTMVVCAFPDSEQRIVVQFPLSAAISWIVQMVGGRAVDTPEDRPLSPIEQALIRTLIADAAENLTNALAGLLPADLSIAGIQYNSQFAQVASASDLVIAVHFSMRLGDRTVPASVMLPAALVLERLTSRSSETPDAVPPGLMRRQIERAPVELALRLEPRMVLPHDVLRLSVGDVVPLAHSADRPLDLVIGDHAVAMAAVGTSGARLACVITATAPAPTEETP